MDRRTLLRALGLAVLGGAGAGCLEQDGSDAAEAGAEPGSIPPDARGNVLQEATHENLDITDSQLYRGQDAFGVVGTVTNVGEEPLESVRVGVRLLDPDDTVLGEFTADRDETEGVWRLESGETEDFDVSFPGMGRSEVQDVVRYEIWADGRVPTGA